jgi:hypothetical protein
MSRFVVAVRTGSAAIRSIPNAAALKQAACRLFGHRAFTEFRAYEPKNERERRSTLARLEEWLDAHFQQRGETHHQSRERWLRKSTGDILDTIETELRRVSGSVAPHAKRKQQTPKRPGRPKADYETVQRENTLAEDWSRARASGAYKPDFAKSKGMTTTNFKRLLDRVAARKREKDVPTNRRRQRRQFVGNKNL